ncbi:hypothetical protein ACQPZX_29785 [Actinoplanes sp. CA-142083]|uniref:hypothetical protein n=1 Tax=Actinoplanes sp. CA-142083 TaxID=3239903 RepID=UPI003D93AE20
MPLILVAGAVFVVLVGGGGFLAMRQLGADKQVPTTTAAEPDPADTVDQPGTAELTPVEPTAVEPTPVEPTAVEPTPVEPTTVEPTTLGPTTFGPTTAAPATEATAGSQQAALGELDSLSRQGLTRVSLGGQLVAQLASKNPGISDPHETTASGSHVFQATDILAEHERLRDDPRNGDATVVLLKSTDYGKRQLYHGKPLYVTFALRAFGSEAAVRAWCARRFPELTGDALANQCAVRRLRPPA